MTLFHITHIDYVKNSFIQTVKEKEFYNSKGIHCIKSAVGKMSITFTIATTSRFAL